LSSFAGPLPKLLRSAASVISQQVGLRRFYERNQVDVLQVSRFC
jgi:hypothetical protein